MFPSRYFPDRYFAPRYFPKAGAAAAGLFPDYDGSGAYVRVNGDVDLTISYPDVVPEGAVCYLHAGHINSSAQAAATYTFPSEFEHRYLDQVASARQWVRRHIADGTEGGTSVTVTVAGGIPTAPHSGVIHVFTDAAPDQEIGPATDGGTSADVTDAGVTTDRANCLALQFGFFSPNQDPGDFTGETGGDWALISQTDIADSGRLWLQSAEMPTADTIDGGGYTKSGLGAWIVRGFALEYELFVPPEPEPEVPAVSGGGGGGWHGDYDFRHRPREKKKRPEIVPLAPAAAVVTEDDAEIVALLLMADGY